MIERPNKRVRQQQGVRLEDFLSLEDSHPYGCLPGGNRFFVHDEEDEKGQRTGSSGPLPGVEERKLFSDEVWQEILRFCDIVTLGRVTIASRYLYVAGHQPELWRDLVLRRCEMEGRVADVTEFPTGRGGQIKSWKDMYLALFVTDTSPRHSTSHVPKVIPGIYSDEYYRTHRCRSFAIPRNWIDPIMTEVEDSIPSMAVESMTPDTFFREYEEMNLPVVIKQAAASTEAFRKWSDPNYLPSTVTPNKSFRTTSGGAPLPANFTLEAYQTYSRFDYLEESPLYLFDRTAFDDNRQWKEDFFPEFYRSCPFWDPSAQYGHDLLQYLGELERPDHTWMIMVCQPGLVFEVSSPLVVPSVLTQPLFSLFFLRDLNDQDLSSISIRMRHMLGMHVSRVENDGFFIHRDVHLLEYFRVKMGMKSQSHCRWGNGYYSIGQNTSKDSSVPTQHLAQWNAQSIQVMSSSYPMAFGIWS